MEITGVGKIGRIFRILVRLLRKFLISIISVGPMPSHIAYIMDGNRRFATKWNLKEVGGHRFGFLALVSQLKYCYEMGIKYVTIYAFSLDNLTRDPKLVQALMILMQEKLEVLMNEESLVSRYGIRICFSGNLKILQEPIRLTMERAMLATAGNSKMVLTICVAYTSTDEIVRAVQASCKEKQDKTNSLNATGSGDGIIKLGDEMERQINVADIEKHMYKAVAPDPDILIRTSGETRLSNFLLWQRAFCLFAFSFGFRHLYWTILNYQRNQKYLQKKGNNFKSIKVHRLQYLEFDTRIVALVPRLLLAAADHLGN